MYIKLFSLALIYYHPHRKWCVGGLVGRWLYRKCVQIQWPMHHVSSDGNIDESRKAKGNAMAMVSCFHFGILAVFLILTRVNMLFKSLGNTRTHTFCTKWLAAKICLPANGSDLIVNIRIVKLMYHS